MFQFLSGKVVWCSLLNRLICMPSVWPEYQDRCPRKSVILFKTKICTRFASNSTALITFWAFQSWKWKYGDKAVSQFITLSVLGKTNGLFFCISILQLSSQIWESASHAINVCLTLKVWCNSVCYPFVLCFFCVCVCVGLWFFPKEYFYYLHIHPWNKGYFIWTMWDITLTLNNETTKFQIEEALCSINP